VELVVELEIVGKVGFGPVPVTGAKIGGETAAFVSTFGILLGGVVVV